MIDGTRSVRRPSPLRLERLLRGIGLRELAAAAKLSPASLSLAERGLGRLSPAAEDRRRQALRVLAEEDA